MIFWLVIVLTTNQPFDLLALISYIKKQNDKSYRRFLNVNYDIIVASTSSEDTYDDLDNTWALHFMKEAELLLEQKIFISLKNKVCIFFYFAKIG